MSESRKGLRIEFYTQDFTTVKLNDSLMTDLLSAVYAEYEKLKNANASFIVTVAKERKNQSFMFFNKDDFLNEFES